MQLLEILKDVQAPIFVIAIFLIGIYVISNPNKISGWASLLDQQTRIRRRLESDLTIRKLIQELESHRQQSQSDKSAIDEASEFLQLLKRKEFSLEDEKFVAEMGLGVLQSWPLKSLERLNSLIDTEISRRENEGSEKIFYGYMIAWFIMTAAWTIIDFSSNPENFKLTAIIVFAILSGMWLLVSFLFLADWLTKSNLNHKERLLSRSIISPIIFVTATLALGYLVAAIHNTYLESLVGDSVLQRDVIILDPDNFKQPQPIDGNSVAYYSLDNIPAKSIIVKTRPTGGLDVKIALYSTDKNEFGYILKKIISHDDSNSGANDIKEPFDKISADLAKAENPLIAVYNPNEEKGRFHIRIEEQSTSTD